MAYFRSYEQAMERKILMEQMGQKCVLTKVFPEGYDLTCTSAIAPKPKAKPSTPYSETPLGRFFEPSSPDLTPRPPPKPAPVNISQNQLMNHSNEYYTNLRPQPMAGAYSYQAEAVNEALQYPTILIELPTGRGKTNVGIGIIAKLQIPTLIVVPTIDLLLQWQSAISSSGGITTSVGAGKEDFSPLTVITYQSAIRHLDEVAKYKLIIFDEVHHLFAPEYVKIVKAVIKPGNHIIGLTASVKAEGSAEAKIQNALFPHRFTRSIAYFQQSVEHKVPLELKTYAVSMADYEYEQYEKFQDILRSVAKKYGSGWMSLGRNMSALPSDTARAIGGALKVFNLRNKLLNELPEKIELIAKIIQAKPGAYIIFTDTIAMVNTIYTMLSNLGIKAEKLHSQMNANREARKSIMEHMRGGQSTVLIGAKAIEEGLDIPNIDNAIFVGNTKKDTRGYIQRAGRILRPIPGKVATIYVLYAKGTIEEQNMQNLYGLYGLT